MQSNQPAAQTKLTAILQGLAVVLLWAPTMPLVKVGFSYLGPLTIAALRFSLGGLILLPWVLKQTGGLAGFVRVPRRYLLLAAVAGVVIHAIGDGFQYLALTDLPASLVGFMQTLAPVIPIIISILWLKDIPSTLQAVGMVIVLVGSLGFLYPFEMVSAHPLAMIFEVIYLLSSGAYALITRYNGKNRFLPALTMSGVGMLAGGLVLWVFALIFEGVPAFSWQGLLVILWLTVMGSSVAFVLFNQAMRRLTVLEMNAIIALLPVSSITLAAIFLKEKITWYQVVSMAVVIGGVLLVSAMAKADPDTPAPHGDLDEKTASLHQEAG
jgi:drug/metabolite transporter (DMT)-like permease